MDGNAIYKLSDLITYLNRYLIINNHKKSFGNCFSVTNVQ